MTVITLCSLVGAVLVRLGRGVGRHYAIAAMLALAVGNLCGDAILHLLPEVVQFFKVSFVSLSVSLLAPAKAWCVGGGGSTFK